MRVRRTTPEAEQREKDEAFLRLTPEERLRMMKEIRDRAWGEKPRPVLKGSRVTIRQKP